MQDNSVLNKSKKSQQNDEFYTTYECIEEELSHYKKSLYGKKILCNTDNPYKSNFSMYFIRNFNKLHLGSLTCTYRNPLENQNGLIMNITSVPQNIDDNCSIEEIRKYIKDNKLVKTLNGDGDFQSNECIEYMKKCDIVVTNPPFSLFKELVSLINKYGKQFLLISNQNALTYKEVFPLIKGNKAWIGYKFGDMSFRVPSYSEPRNTRYWVDENGQKWRSLGNAMWLTNIDIPRRHDKIILTQNYSASRYPKYDKFNAIEVAKVAEIPKDYDGIMGVPITFLNKYNPEQFEIIGEANHGSDNEFDLFKPTVDGKLKYKRILIKGVDTNV